MIEKIELFKALAAFQAECPAIYKSSKGFGYKYAGLEQVATTIQPYLTKHNLGYTQLGDGTSIITVLFHTESGQSIVSEFTIPEGVELKGMNDFQVMGSVIKYFRRYALEAILGLVTSEDTDTAEIPGKKKSKIATPKAIPKKVTPKKIVIPDSITEAQIKTNLANKTGHLAEEMQEAVLARWKQESGKVYHSKYIFINHKQTGEPMWFVLTPAQKKLFK
jgi:hypothetical protein